MPPTAAMTETRSPINSDPRDGSRSYTNSAHRYLIATLCPSANPSVLRPARNAAVSSLDSSRDLVLRKPIVGIGWLRTSLGRALGKYCREHPQEIATSDSEHDRSPQ